MSKHTEGPWETAKKFDHQHYIEVQHKNLNMPGAASGVVARVTCRQTWQAEQEANARLIAAAPDLLEELTSLLAMCERQTDFNDDGDGYMFDRCRAAINKATGMPCE